MKKDNALKKLNKLSGNMENSITINNGRVNATFKYYDVILSFFIQDDEITCISTKLIGLENDSMTDLFYNVYHDNLSRALRFINR